MVNLSRLILPLFLVLGCQGANIVEERAAQAQKPLSSGSDIAQVKSKDNFVRVDGLTLRQGSDQQQHYLSALNYWSCMNLAAGKEADGDYQRLLEELDQMAEAGINHLRVMAASEGSPTRQPFRILPALQTSPGRYDEDVFVGLDRCVAEAAKRGFRLTMVLGNTWQWTGGLAQLYSWAHKDQEIPYPRSWNISAAPQRHDGVHAGWGNWTRASDGPFNEMTNKFYTDEAAQKIYNGHVLKVLHRKNTVNGLVYSQDPAIMAWEPINEPQVQGDYSRPHPEDAMIRWHNSVAALIKANTPHQLVTTGFEGKQGRDYFRAIAQSRDIDYACIHIWPHIWGYYDMLDASKENLNRALDFVKDYIANAEKWASELGKPLFVEEFGFPRDNWLLDVTKGDYQYGSRATTTHRDALFQQVLSQVWESYSEKRGLVGAAPWSYGGISRPETQILTKQGIVWSGDPPQEPPGWHSIYDGDASTLKLFQRQCELAGPLACRSLPDRK